MTYKNSSVPYYSSYGTPELILDFADGHRSLEDDPRWATTGAATPGEYVLWARNGCGMACLQMILATTGISVPPLVELGRRCEAYGGYRRNGARFEGLIYAPFVEFCVCEFSLSANVAAPLAFEELVALVRNGHAVLASVSKSIRQPDEPVRSRGGHLVLVFAEGNDAVCFHNPSGHTAETQRDVWMTAEQFGRFFAGRGVSVRLETASR